MFPTGKVQVKSYYKGKKNIHSSPIKTYPSPSNTTKPTEKQPNTIIRFTHKDYYDDQQLQDTTALRPTIQQASNNWWSWTFVLSTFPFLLVCPTHQVLQNGPFPFPTDTMSWIYGIFSLSGIPYKLLFSFFLIIPTALMNAYTIYKFALAFDSLFITAQYEASLFQNVTRAIQYFMLVIPLDCIWLNGYKAQNIIHEWNNLYRKYRGEGCLCFNFRFRVFLLVILIYGVFGIRYVTRLQHALNIPGITVLEKVEEIMEFVVDLGISLMLPLYCTFCYAVKFHLMVIKATVYKWIRDKVTPGMEHLNAVKILYTQVSDSILQINGWFYFYMSGIIGVIILETLVGSKLAFARFLIPSSIGPLFGFLAKLKAKDVSGTQASSPPTGSTPPEVREFNLELLGIVLMIGSIFWVIWQAVKTNDCAREIHVWLNDFAIGGEGTNVRNILRGLGVMETTKMNNTVLLVRNATDGIRRQSAWDEECLGIYPQTRILENNEFLGKLALLKAYIHVKMELEDAAMLNIAIVGLLKPNLNRRLGNYRVYF